MSEDDKPSVKAKLPSAREISRTDFTPHGIKSKGGPRKPSGLTAAEAQKRKRIGIAVAVVVVLAIAGGVGYVVTRPGPKVTVTGAFGKAPQVKIPSDLKPPKTLQTQELIKGKGQTVTKDDTVYLKFAGYDWTSKQSKKIDQFSYDQAGGQAQNLPMTTPADQKQQAIPLLETLQKTLKGAHVGSRFLLKIPPKNGYGDQGNPQFGIGGTDTMLWVLDVVAATGAHPAASGTPQQLNDPQLPTVKDNGAGKAPAVTIPKGSAPQATTVKTLIQGAGPVVTKGQTVLAQYQGQIWDTSKVFDSSWAKGGQPVQFPKVGQGGLVPGMDKSLVGQRAGSRLLLMIPPADGYGKDGNAQAGIKGTDTLVFVVDVIASY